MAQEVTQEKLQKWQEATVTLAFVVAAGIGGTYVMNKMWEQDNAKNAQTISELKKHPLASYNLCTRFPTKTGDIKVCETATRSIDGQSNLDHTNLMFSADTKEGIRVFGSVRYDYVPHSRSELYFFKYSVIEAIVKQDSAGISACDLFKHDGHILPGFHEAKRTWLDVNGDPSHSRAKNYEEKLLDDTKTALDRLKASGACRP